MKYTLQYGGMIMLCNICGKENKSGANFCAMCRNKLTSGSDSETIAGSSGFSAIKGNSSVLIKDSIVIGDRDSMNAEDVDDMGEITEALELKRMMKSIKREDAEGYQDIENRAKIAEAKAEAIKINAKHGGSKGNDKLKGLDIARTLNELKDLCSNDEDVFTINMKMDILTKMIEDEESIRLIEMMNKRLNTMYDDFSKLKDEDKKRIQNLCNYIGDVCFRDEIHGKGDDDDSGSDGVAVTGDGNLVATGGGTVNSVVNIRK